MSQANYPIVQASVHLFEAMRAALEEAFPGRVRQHEDCFYVDEPVSHAEYNAIMDKLEAIDGANPHPNEASVKPSLTYTQKRDVEAAVRNLCVTAVQQVNVLPLHYATLTDSHNELIKAYAAEVRDDIARTLGADS